MATRARCRRGVGLAQNLFRESETGRLRTTSSRRRRSSEHLVETACRPCRTTHLSTCIALLRKLLPGPSFPFHAIEYCLAEASLAPDELDYVGFYEKSFLKFDRLLETYLAYAPAGFKSFLRAMPSWLKKKLLCKHQRSYCQRPRVGRSSLAWP